MTLTLLFASLSGLAMTILFALCPTLSFWWRLPVFLGFYVAIALLYIAILLVSFLLLPKADPSPHTRSVCHRWIELTLSWIFVMIGYKVTVEGTDKLPNVPYLLVGNHRSAFDPLCTEAALEDHDIAFVCKPSVMKIPVIGRALTKLRFLAIDRDNARNAVTTIKRAAELITDVGLSVGIYPEGTRSKTGDLLPFHAGSFKIAKLANCPVAVATVRYEKSGLLPWNRRVSIRIVDVMDVDFVANSNTAALAERTEQAIREDLGL